MMQSLNAAQQPQSLTDSQLQQVTDCYEDLAQVFKFHQGLSPVERQRMIRPKRQNLIFVHDSIDAVAQVPEIVPGYLDKDRVKEVANLHDQLRYLEQIHQQVGDALHDLRLVAGDEAYRNARLIYQGAKTAAKEGYPKVRPIYDQMKQRFAPQAENDRNVGEEQGETGQSLSLTSSESDQEGEAA